MNIKVFQDRKIEKDYFYNEGSQNENNSTVLTFEIPFGYEDYSKRIVFMTEEGNYWDYIKENSYTIKNNITKYENIEAYLWLTKDDNDFRTETFPLNFYQNENPDELVPTEEQIDGFATIIKILEEKIDEVEALKIDIGDFKKALEDKVDKEDGKGLSTNDFTNELKDKLDKLENYDDAEIKESVENIKNDLTNYYKKSETYNKEEIDNKISKIPKLDIEVVDSLPTENISEEKLYLIKSGAESENLYTEYIYVNGKWEKLGEQKLNISHLATKIELEEVKTELNAEIERLTAENEQQANQIKYLDKTLTRAEASGENINIKNSAEYPISEITIDTNIKQDKRDGYNELDLEKYYYSESASTLNGGTVTFNNGVAKIDGTNAVGTVSVRSVNRLKTSPDNIILPPGTYYFGINVNGYYENDIDTLVQTQQGIRTLTDNYIITQWYTTCSAGSTVEKTLLISNDTSKTTYEQYGSMPSIEFPSEIQTPVGKQEFYAGNKNKLKKFNETSSYSNVAIEITNGYRFKVNGTPNLTWVNLFSAKELKISKGETITFSTKNMKHSLYARINYSDGTYNNYVEIGKTSKTLTLSKDMVSYYLYISGLTVGTAIDYEFEAQLEYGDTATEIVEPQSQVQDLDLTSELLGTIVDKEDGSYFENRYLRIILNENTQPTYFVEQGNYTLFQYNTNNVLTNVYCDKLKFKGNWGTNYNYESIYRGGSTLKNIQVKILSSRLTEISTNGIQQWLSENNLNCLCELATPTYTKLTDEQQAQWNAIKKMHTYEGVTNIYTINENGISPVINMKYVKSPKLIQDDYEKRIAALESAVVGG